MTQGALYHSIVRHIRHRPMRHRFSYSVFSCLFDLETLPDLDLNLRLFSYNRFGLFSFHDRDHGPRDGSPLRPWIENLAQRAGIEQPLGRIDLLCFPRILGFVFNPLSVYWVRDNLGKLCAIIYEVKNTFGDQHCYVHRVSDNGAGPLTHERAKDFFVSPFIDMTALYRFRVRVPDQQLSILIREFDANGCDLLTASMVGTREPLSDSALFRAFFRYPLMTIKVVAGIHYEALRLLFKGAKLRTRPAPPADEATI